ncbi:MAG: serine/threonine-protein kinase [Myxococcota bacterium]|nr:serine/threonine-protein kinase [Myxococcota bacterium]
MNGTQQQDKTFPQKFGEYWLIRKIATGGMAEIFLARSRSAGGVEKYFALKMIHPRYLEEKHFHRMIVEEAKIAVRLHHKNVGQVFDLGCVDGRYFIVMEFIDGYDLSRLHEQCRQRNMMIPLDIAAYIGREVCGALHYAHNLLTDTGDPLNLIHRDISPQNILVSFNGDVKIIDFGIAKVSTQIQQTQVGVIKGKFYYMSPEQAGASDVDQRSDLFSLGICLWETVTGQSLFRREGGPTNPLAILHEIRTMPIPRVREYRRDCPAPLDDAIARALSRDIKTRYSVAAEMYRVFDHYLSRYAPNFDVSKVKSFMVRAYEKVETTKEMPRVNTGMFDLMQRGDFMPSEASVIFNAADLTHHSKPKVRVEDLRRKAAENATAIFDAAEGNEIISGVAESVRMQSDTDTAPDVPAVSSTELAVSETVFLLADDVAEMERRGERPEVVSPKRKGAQTDKITSESPGPSVSDPNLRTQALSLTDIQAAHAAFQKSQSESAAKPSKVQEHPLFRWLALAILVMCLLVGTLSLLLRQRALVGSTNSAETSSPTVPADTDEAHASSEKTGS